MVNKLGNLKLEEVNHIKKVFSFEFSLLTLFYDEDTDLLCETPNEAISIFQKSSVSNIQQYEYLNHNVLDHFQWR